MTWIEAVESLSVEAGLPRRSRGTVRRISSSGSKALWWCARAPATPASSHEPSGISAAACLLPRLAV